MHTYLPLTEAQQFVANPSKIYPHYDEMIDLYPPVQAVVTVHDNNDRSFGMQVDRPAPLIVESMYYLGSQPKRIIDIGAELGRHSLYLAMHGHSVLAVDIDDSNLEFAHEHARRLGIPTHNFRVLRADVRDLDASDRYDAVLANMLLHFLDQADNPRTVQAFQNMTLGGGINVVSTYTTDNPEAELTQRGLRHLVRPEELRRSYISSEWVTELYREGPGTRVVTRQFQSEALVPTLAEIIATKGIRTQPRRSYMNANREIVFVD